MTGDESSRLSALIWTVTDPKNLDKATHGPGYHLIHDGAARQESERVMQDRVSLLRGLAGKSGALTHYFIKTLPKPLEIGGLSFRWAEPARRIDLELQAALDIHVTNLDQAKALVARLHAPEGPGKALYALIDSVLHTEIEQRARDNTNLLDEFLPARRGAQGRVSLSDAVSDRVSAALGNARFRIGFHLDREPPRTLEIQEHKTDFKTSDTSDLRHVLTTANIELENYQAFRHSGLKDKVDLELAVRAAIDAVVKERLFGKPYYDIAASFDSAARGRKAIKAEIEADIVDRLGHLGYRVRLFNTLPTIQALSLARGVRVDVVGKEYRTRSSIGVVKMDVSVSVMARNFKLLADLIPPECSDIKGKLSEALAVVCRDQVLKIDRKRFNLEFDSAPPGKTSVVDQLTAAFNDVFDRRYGLAVTVINVVQSQTEEAQRFECVRGAGAWPFALNITSRANAGKRDAVRFDGEFEVLAMGRDGWETFESRDFGFRRDSVFWTSSELAAFEQQLGPGVVATDADRERERQAYAVRRELTKIAARITSLLQDALKALPDLAVRSRDYKNLRNLEQQAFKLVRNEIEDEFGLVIRLRKFERQDTATERSNALIHDHMHATIHKRAGADANHALEMADTERSHREERKQTLLGRLADLSDRHEDDPTRKSDEAAIRAELATLDSGPDWGSISGETLSTTMENEESQAAPAGLLGDELVEPERPSRRRLKS